MLPFQQQAAVTAQYEQFIGGGNPLATLTLSTLPNQVTVPVTHTYVDADFLLTAGRSDITTIERCEFRACLIDSKCLGQIGKGLRCQLIIKPGMPPLGFQLWNGGLMEGGEIFRFMLVSDNFHG